MVREIDEQHPIPQDISSYQFRLVGDMTLKQFMQVAGGALTALLIYSTPLNAFIKWPLILFSVLFGIALAFLPIEDRPLATWLIVFFKSVYSPTIFVWKKTPHAEEFYRPEPIDKTESVKVELLKEVVSPEAPATTGTIFMSEEEAETVDVLEKKEVGYLSRIAKLFSTQNLLGIQPTGSSPTSPPMQFTQPHGVHVASVTEKADKQEKAPVETAEELDTSQIVSSVKPAFTPPPSVDQNTQGLPSAQFAYSTGSPPPPTIPNIVVGQVVDTQGGIVEAAILEIKDNLSRPVRALRTNKLGHFMIVTPLVNGDYQIIAEKEGFKFDTYTFTAKGEIIQPLVIKAVSQFTN
jgi:hypothetical protein